MRRLLLALQGVIGGNFQWLTEAEWLATLDPVVTVHRDQVFFEAFSQDMSAYGWVSIPMAEFEVQGQVEYGTTNIDFTHQLGTALQRLRSSRHTVLTVGAGGVGVKTDGQGHFEKKVDLPDPWQRGFVQIQSALGMAAWQTDVRPADLLSVMAWLREHRPPGPPHGLRFQFSPGEEVSLVAEPWEDHPFRLRGTRYDGVSRSIRVWGRKRLALLSPILPYADRVTVGLPGRSLPHWYVCHVGPYRFAVVLSGHTRANWSESFFDLLAPTEPTEADMAEAMRARLQDRQVMTLEEAGPNAESALLSLCRSGEAMRDPVDRTFRWRPLFDTPLLARAAGGDARVEQALGLMARITTVDREARSPHGRVETHLLGEVDGEKVKLALDAAGRLRFGQCTCEFFRNHFLADGPCVHMLAVRSSPRLQAPEQP
jgi:hypothetical protein